MTKKKSNVWADFLPLWMGLLFIGLYLLMMWGLFAFGSGRFISEKEAVKYERECVNKGGVPYRRYGEFNDEIGKIQYVVCRPPE